MEGTDETSMGSSLFPKNHNQLQIPNTNTSQFGLSSQNMSHENNNNMPMTPPHSLPYRQISIPKPASQQPINQNLGFENFHSRSLSHPALVSMNFLSPISLFPQPSSSTATLENAPMNNQAACSQGPTLDFFFPRGDFSRACESLLPHKGHRRANSDLPLGFCAMIQSSPQLLPISHRGVEGHLVGDKPAKHQLNWDRNCISNAEGTSKRKSEGEVLDELFNDCVNFEIVERFNSVGNVDKDMGSRASGTHTQGGETNDNEVESSLKGKPQRKYGPGFVFSNEERGGGKRKVGHFRSISMDSFIGNMNFSDESPKLQLTLGTGVGLHSPSDSTDRNSLKFSTEFGNGEFSEFEMKKIMANEKLAEVALSDPKRAKRILANRQSAVRSKERKTRHISELEHKVLTLQAEATALSTQLTLLQGEAARLTSQNNELRFRLRAMEQQAQLRDVINEALAAEVQRLKLATAAEL